MNKCSIYERGNLLRSGEASEHLLLVLVIMVASGMFLANCHASPSNFTTLAPSSPGPDGGSQKLRHRTTPMPVNLAFSRGCEPGFFRASNGQCSRGFSWSTYWNRS